MTRLRGDADARPRHGLALPAEPPRPPSPPASFEFVHIIGSEMCAAEDVFFRGQILPYKPPPASARSPAQPHPAACVREHRRSPSDQEGHPGRHRRAESLDGYERRAGAASRYWKTKGSHSADYQRLRPVAETLAPARPKWYMLVFGSVRVPAEMDMKSIRGRLRRRSGSGGDCGRADSVGAAKASGGAGGAWKLLRSLSCKGDVGGVVDAPLKFGLA